MDTTSLKETNRGLISYGYFIDLSLWGSYVIGAEDVVSSCENLVGSGVESEFSFQRVEETPQVSKVK